MRRDRRKVIGQETLPGGREADVVYEGDPSSRPVAHSVVRDSLGLMHGRGTLSDPAYAAATHFQEDFIRASFPDMRAGSLVFDGAYGEDTVTEARLRAKKRINEALDAVGGITSPPGSAVWFICGRGDTVNQWRQRQAWGDKRLSADRASGILIGALEGLAAFYGYRRD